MKKLRLLLFPFALLYGLITSVRNYFYNKGILKSEKFELPIICVGNLNMGGTGKSPMIEYLIRTLVSSKKVAVLSRGYKRKTTGYIEISENSLAENVGDEPLQFKNKFAEITVAVNADRVEGINNLKNNAEVVLLDDAFQHRKVQPSFSILLTAFSDLYVDDYILPAGNLRESKNGAKRADVIIVTKCPENITPKIQKEIRIKIKPLPQQKLFFAGISYDDFVYSKSKKLLLEDLLGEDITLVTGIANPKQLCNYLNEKKIKYNHLSFSDHHNFSESELNLLKTKKRILTTEKDFMRLKDSLNTEDLFYLPIKTSFINDDRATFEEIILNHLDSFEV